MKFPIYIYIQYIYIWKKKSSKPPTHMNIDSYWIAPLSRKHGFIIFIRKLSTISWQSPNKCGAIHHRIAAQISYSPEFQWKTRGSYPSYPAMKKLWIVVKNSSINGLGYFTCERFSHGPPLVASSSLILMCTTAPLGAAGGLGSSEMICGLNVEIPYLNP